MSWSFGIHVGAILVAVLLPTHWFVTAKPEPILMTISLGSTPGERTGGLSTAGARPVERAVPEPPRPTPVPPATPPKTTPAAVAPTKPTPPKTTPTAGPPTTPPERPPTTGQQVTKGTAAAETGSKTQGTGLTFGGGQAGAQVTVDIQFCCPDYAEELQRRINRHWQSMQSERGVTELRFEIRRDGTFSTPEITKSSGSSLLDRASRAAFLDLELPHLPAEYKGATLVIRMSVEYRE
jgi:outer membrane biosynthesis protein TonB